jgi:hypothetical protein
LNLYRDDRVVHRDKPCEPWGKLNQSGTVIRVAPSGSHIPAQAYVDWDVPEGQPAFQTWELVRDLSVL